MASTGVAEMLGGSPAEDTARLLADRVTDARPAGVDRMRLVGAWSARCLSLLVLGYVAVFVAGFASVGDLAKPLPDPYLAVAEVMILVIAPIMLLMMAAIHHGAPQDARPFTRVASGWMTAASALTILAHFVQLTVARHIDPALSGYARIFGWQWPLTLYALDIVAWDVFFGLSLLFAVPAFTPQHAAAVRRWLIVSGSLCLIGLVGPFFDAMEWRMIGVAGYRIVFGIACIRLGKWFTQE